MSANPARLRWRNRLFLAGLLPLVVALLFTAKVALMLSAQAAGESAYDADNFAKATKKFAGNSSLNLMEPWIAPFNEGTARQRDEDYVGALERYDVALDDAPTEQDCTVRINMALSHEALGDAAVGESGSTDTGAPAPDGDAAIKAWQAGRDVLAAGDCPTDAAGGEDQTDDAVAVDERLRQKIEEQQQSRQQDPKPKKSEKKGESEKLKEQKEKLEKRNAQGRAEREQNKEYQEYSGTDSSPGYEW